MKTQQSKTFGCSKSSSKREVYSDKRLPQETQKISNIALRLKKEEQTKSKVSRRKDIKIRAGKWNRDEENKGKLSTKIKAGSLKSCNW